MRGDGDGEDPGMEQILGAIEDMGFESFEDFSMWLEGLNESDQLDAMLELISRLGE